MLLVKTYLDRSAIHGLGVFAGHTIRKGTKVWRFVDGFDRVYSPTQFAKLPKPARDYIWNYGYRVDGEILLTSDHDHHMNHSDNANTHWRNGHIVARRTIRKGEEITNNYREFDAGFCA
ncbi:MAG: SET domain-containing protein, partial [Pseudolabrys sp.]